MKLSILTSIAGGLLSLKRQTKRWATRRLAHLFSLFAFRIQSYSAAGPVASFAPAGAACFAPAVRCGSSAASDSQAGIHPHNESSRFVPPFAV